MLETLSRISIVAGTSINANLVLLDIISSKLQTYSFLHIWINSSSVYGYSGCNLLKPPLIFAISNASTPNERERCLAISSGALNFSISCCVTCGVQSMQLYSFNSTSGSESFDFVPEILSTTSLPILRNIVHFPPDIVMKLPVCCIKWLLEIEAVSPLVAFGSITSGRIPDQQDFTLLIVAEYERNYLYFCL
ncbi:hypothetical protein RF11_07210 [Thelohanellus kitauei]|uniref:Uncharacterized protein n=1 Tax=Thelohanellus kitauei TaxID=669202 RepID=A0A0C2MNC3_THEKT|nr:hypothetical protein RF11_07210 [Thelohanellus kitauei]